MNPTRLFRTPRWVLITAFSLSTAACDSFSQLGGPDDSASSGLGLAVPAPLLQARAIDRSQLRPTVTLGDGRQVTMSPVNDRWRGTINVAPEQDYMLTIVWIEDIVTTDRTRALPLATLTRSVFVGAEGEVFSLDSDQYEYRTAELDFDGDGLFNFDERVANTDPFGPGALEDDLPNDSESETPATDGTPEDDAPVAMPDQETTEPPENTKPDPADVPATPIETETVNPPLETPETPPVADPEADPVEESVDTPVEVPDPPLPEPDPVAPVEPPVEPTSPDPEPSAPVDEAPTEAVSQASVIIPRIASSDAPMIDGQNVVTNASGVPVGEWSAATSFDVGGSRLFVDRLMIDKGTDEVNGQAFRSWSAMHDGEFLYVLVVVEDDGRRFRDSEEVWRDDSLEVYIDGNNSKNTTYDDGEDDDSSRLIPLVEPGTTRSGTTDGLVRGFLSLDAPIEIDFATGPGIGPDGIRRPRFEQDVYELRIKLESAGILPGRPMGFELQVNDDDDGGDRDAKWGWAHPARTSEDVDFTFMDPSLMGTVVLE